MKETVKKAVDDIKTAFPDNTVTAQEDGQGGAWILIEDVPTGQTYSLESTWVGFHVTFQYPYADVYPHFIRSDLTRKDQRPLGDGISGGHNFLGRPALQVSRRSNRLNPNTDTALLKLMKVLEWLKTRP